MIIKAVSPSALENIGSISKVISNAHESLVAYAIESMG